jgi:hypothetical protein
VEKDDVESAGRAGVTRPEATAAAAAAAPTAAVVGVEGARRGAGASILPPTLRRALATETASE